MPNTSSPLALEFLRAEHDVWIANRDAWLRDERRLEGGDNVLSELARFKGEDELRYSDRKAQAAYLNFARIHAQTLAGHLARVAPRPNFGTLGEVRERNQIDTPTIAELIYYNVNGLGAGGTQWPAWWTDVQERACATGHRWITVEMPPFAIPGRSVIRRMTKADVRNGQRPYLVSWPSASVPYWEIDYGRLDWLVIKRRLGRAGITAGGTWMPADQADGYYLLVRQGYGGLGDEYAGGGWWMFDSQGLPLTRDGVPMQGNWERTRGEIPCFPLVASPSDGTVDRPAMSRSLTMELGQIGISLMNRISERNYDASDAAKSIKYFLGVDKAGFNLMMDYLEDGAIGVPVVPSENPTNPQAPLIIPQIYDGSAGAVAATVFQTIIDGTLAEAHEIMVRQMTSTPDSSGASKQAGFGEATSPLLAGLAQRREAAENAALYFLELRAGASNPTGVVEWPTQFELTPIVAKVDAIFARMKGIGARSATLSATLIETAAADDGLWPTEDAKATAARDELAASLALADGQAIGVTVKALTDAGAMIGGAAELAGLTPAQQKLLVEGNALDQAQPAPPAPVIVPPIPPGGNGNQPPNPIPQPVPAGAAG